MKYRYFRKGDHLYKGAPYGRFFVWRAADDKLYIVHRPTMQKLKGYTFKTVLWAIEFIKTISAIREANWDALSWPGMKGTMPDLHRKLSRAYYDARNNEEYALYKQRIGKKE